MDDQTQTLLQRLPSVDRLLDSARHSETLRQAPHSVLRNAARTALEQEGLADVPLVGLAKREEDIYTQGCSQPLKLPTHSPVRKLLQYVRDEAHRFAQHYHHILRRKKMFDDAD